MTAPMRILTSDRVFSKNVGGNTTYAANVYAGLEERGHQHVTRGAPPLPAKARGAGYAAWDGLVLPLTAERCGADVLHFPSDTGALVRSRLPVVSTVHGIASRHVDGVRSPRQERVWRTRVGRMINLSAAVITPSRSSADDLIAQFGCDPKRLHVIPHGLAHDVFHPLDRTEAERRLEGVELPERFALYVGNIEPRKNIPTLLRAFEQPELASTDLGLVLAGRPAWNYGTILEAIDRAPRATYLGGVPREWLSALMSLASVFVFPSRYEGFGFPVLEAMAVGTPVITTRRGSLQEVADDAVLYVDPEDPHALARTIHEVVSDGEVGADLRARGLARAALFRWETSVTHHEHVFQEAVAEG